MAARATMIATITAPVRPFRLLTNSLPSRDHHFPCGSDPAEAPDASRSDSSSVAKGLTHPDSWVEYRIENIDNQIDGQEQHSRDKHDALHYGVVDVRDRL